MATPEITSTKCKLFESVGSAPYGKPTPPQRLNIVHGSLPKWLSGSLYRNGPGRWDVGGMTHGHVFDGLAVIRKVEIDGAAGSATYTHAFVQSRSAAAAANGRMLREFGTDPAKTVFGRALTLFKGKIDDNPDFSDNTNVSIIPMFGELIALTEVPIGYVIDAASLETKGRFTGSPEYHPMAWHEAATMCTAHRMYHPDRKLHVTVATRFTPPYYYYDVVLVPEERTLDEIVYGPMVASPPKSVGELNAVVEKAGHYHRVPVDTPAYQHSFAITQDYVILTEQPLLFSVPDLLKTLMGGRIITDMFGWRPEAGTYFRVIHIETGKEVARIAAPTFFTLHHVNAFQRTRQDAGGGGGGVETEIVLDSIAYDNPQVLHEFSMTNLRGGSYGGGAVRSVLRRFVLNLTSGTATEEPGTDMPVYDAAEVRTAGGHVTSLTPTGRLGGEGHYLELASVHPALVGRPYRYAYAVRASPVTFIDGLFKLDWQQRIVTVWSSPGCTPCEPIFVPRPTVDASGAVASGPDAHPLPGHEDDGVVLSIVLDEARGTSFLLVLDARDMSEVARCYYPDGQHAPMTFHGTYLRQPLAAAAAAEGKSKLVNR